MKTLISIGKDLEKYKLNFFHSAVFQIKTTTKLKYFVNGCLWKPYFDFHWPQTSSNLNSLAILVTIRPFTLF